VIAVGRSVDTQAGLCHHDDVGRRREKLYLIDIAKMKGVQPDTLSSERSRGRMPEPDGVDLVGGHARPWWRPETARAWLASRPGKGWRRGRSAA
jgi:hypothetical protein